VWFNFSNVEGSLTGRNEEREKKRKGEEREREMRKGKKGPIKPNA